MGAHRDGGRPVGQPRQDAVPVPAFFPSGQNLRPNARGFGQRRDGRQVLAGQYFRRREYHRLAAILDRRQHGQQRNYRLAGAHITLQQPVHAGIRCHIRRDLVERPGLGVGQPPGEGGQDLVPEHARAGRGTSPLVPHMRPHQSQRQLVGEQFVVGEPAARRRFRRQIILGFGAVQGFQRLPPCRPGMFLPERRIEPFGEDGSQREGAADGLGQHFQGQALGQRIDRLHRLQLVALRRGAHVIRMGHLDFIVEALDLAADDPRLALGQDVVQVIGARMKEDQRHAAGLVFAGDFVGQAPVGRRVMGHHVHRDRRDNAGRRIGDPRREPAVDQAARQVPEQIGDVRAGNPLDQRGDPRPDPFQGGDGGEDGKQDFGSHEPVPGLTGAPGRFISWAQARV